MICTEIISEKDKRNERDDQEIKIETECTIPISRKNFNEKVKFITLNKYDFIIIIKGDIKNKKEVLFRIHSGCLTGDLFNSERCDCGQQLDYYFNLLNDYDNGVLLYLPKDEGRGIGIFNKLKAYSLMENKYIDTFQANNELNFNDDERDFSYINEIINFLEIESIDLVTNNKEKINSIDEQYLNKVINSSIILKEYNFSYLKTKQDSKGHDLKLENYKNVSNVTNLTNKVNNKRIAILHTTWNKKYIDILLEGYVNKIKEFGENELIFKEVSGSFDLIGGAIKLTKDNVKKFDVFIFIGILLKGETSHYEFLMNSISYGIQQFQLKYEIPVINGILTCENEDQIKNRTIFNNHGVHWGAATISLLI